MLAAAIWQVLAVASWKEVPLIPVDEELVRASGPRLLPQPAYAARGYQSAIAEIWVRRSVAEALNRAAGLLPDGLCLILWDGWRPLSLQAELYEECREHLARTVHLRGAELERETLRFVSAPDPDPASPPPHLTGGAIDLTLGTDRGEPLPMGSDFDEFDDHASTSYYEDLEEPTDEQLRYRVNHRLLGAVMTSAGFSNYPEEWWHYDLGNQFHHARVGGEARYGLIEALPGAVEERRRRPEHPDDRRVVFPYPVCEEEGPARRPGPDRLGVKLSP